MRGYLYSRLETALRDEFRNPTACCRFGMQGYLHPEAESNLRDEFRNPTLTASVGIVARGHICQRDPTTSCIFARRRAQRRTPLFPALLLGPSGHLQTLMRDMNA